MKVIIVGGVAAGATAAARLRRLDETVSILLLERGAYISYANCGLPYHIGRVIPERESLSVIDAAEFKARFNVDVRTQSEVMAIDPARKCVTVRHEGGSYEESYDKLLIATGSSPVQMALPGADPERVLPLWTIPDMDRILEKVKDQARSAVVVGAGFIGLEAAENLRLRGLSVTVVELAPQVLPTLDSEMTAHLAQTLSDEGIELKLGRKVSSFSSESGYAAVLDDGERVPADLVLMCVGVKPNSQLAQSAGLNLGPRGHIVVNSSLQTSDPDIYAAGDVIEVYDPISGQQTAVPLAGPANKQGRIAAENMLGRGSVYAGTLGAAVIKVGHLTAASVGLTERRLKQLNIAFRKIYTHPGSHASYYPGAAMLHLKLLYGEDGRILGAQAVGAKGADKRIDVIATAMKGALSAYDLAALELCYAPPYNSAKDPVNFLGMIACDIRDNLTDPVYADAIPGDAFLLDVREAEEFGGGTIPGAVNIPLSEVRGRLGELPRNRKIVVFCKVGVRGYLAERILKQNGFACANLSGGYLTWKSFFAPLRPPVKCHVESVPTAELPPEEKVLDVRALACPGPVVRLKQTVDQLPEGGILRILASESFAPDLSGWLALNKHELLSLEMKEDYLEAVVRKGGVEKNSPEPKREGNGRGAIILFSNDLDKALAALIVACGMAASGMKVSIFFTFWGLSVLRKHPAPAVKKSLIGRMFGWMLPKGADRLSLSKMNFFGAGAFMMKGVMVREKVPSLPELLTQARELGVEFIACEMAMNVMGLKREELLAVDAVAGVASFVERARNSDTSLFI